MKNDLQAIKRQVTADWGNAFPALSRYKNNKFYRIAGPLVVGIELIVLPGGETYRPHFVVYPLWGADSTASLRSPTILIEFKNRKGLQLDIPYEKHAVLFPEVPAFLQEQIPIRMGEDVLLHDILALIDVYLKTGIFFAAPTSFLVARMHEFKLNLLITEGCVELLQDELNRIRHTNWDKDHFALCNADVTVWQESLIEKTKQREVFLRRVENNKNDKVLAKIKKSEIII